MSDSLYSYIDVEAKTAASPVLGNLIREVLRAEKGECYNEIESLLMPPGKSGSRSFDQAYAVETLLQHDRNSNESINKMMAATPTLTHKTLWDKLYSVLRQSGFKMRHGRLVGLLEHNAKNDTDGDIGQPDLE